MAFRWLALCSIALLAVGRTAVSAREFIVATNGGDQAAGTKAAPLRTLGKAVAVARAGDVILVRGGVYRERVRLANSGSKDTPITLKNYAGERPTIQPSEQNQKPPQGILLQARAGHQKPIGWIVIEGFEIRYGYDGIKFYNAHDIVIRNCRIRENWNQGILGNGQRVLIDRNVIADNGTNKNFRPSLMHGIYATGTAFTITNNLIYANSGHGIQVAAYPYKEEDMAGSEYAWAKDWLIANNTLAFQKTSAGIVLWQDGVENCVVQNNIFYKNARPNGIVFYSQKGRRHLVRNNIFYPPGKSLASSEKDAYRAVDNQQTDPRFVDPESFDFHLKPGSPAIDAGTAARAPKTDFEGKPRPQGGKVDIGAYSASAGGAGARRTTN